MAAARVLVSDDLSAEAVEGTLALLQPEDFVRPAHARIFSAMSDLYNRSVPIDHLSVADRLESTGEIENAGGKAYLLDVTGVVPTAANWVRYAEIVKRTSMLRQLIGAGTQIVALGYDAPDDLDQVVGDAEKLVFLSDVNGVRRDKKDPASLIDSLTAAEARRLIASGAIESGMIPKVQACLETLRHGVSKIHIIDGRLRHSLLLEIYTSRGVGTEIIQDVKR